MFGLDLDKFSKKFNEIIERWSVNPPFYEDKKK